MKRRLHHSEFYIFLELSLDILHEDQIAERPLLLFDMCSIFSDQEDPIAIEKCETRTHQERYRDQRTSDHDSK
jgi:hypothetical protein